MAQFTPMIEQYLKVKEQYPDAILFFRLGDFYEMFFDDAKTASRELELVLTGRDCGREEKAPMCGIPYHAADSYIAKLVAKGYKVAICEQMEDPAAAKGIVKRDVIRVHTPGTVIESAMLDEGKNNYLGCIYSEEQNIGLCFADISTGSICATEFSGSSARERAISEIARFAPAEILVNGYTAKLSEVNEFLTRKITLFAETLDDSKFDADTCEKIVTGLYKKPLSELNLQDRTYALRALGATIFYLEQVQKNDLGNINEPEIYNDERFMTLNASARLNLELCETQRRREKKAPCFGFSIIQKLPWAKGLFGLGSNSPLSAFPI